MNGIDEARRASLSSSSLGAARWIAVAAIAVLIPVALLAFDDGAVGSAEPQERAPRPAGPRPGPGKKGSAQEKKPLQAPAAKKPGKSEPRPEGATLDATPERLQRGKAVLNAALTKRGGAKALLAIRDYVEELSGKRFQGDRSWAIASKRSVLLTGTRCFKDEYRETFNAAREERRTLVLRGKRGHVRHDLGGMELPSASVAGQWGSFNRSDLEILRAAITADAAVLYAGEGKIEGKVTDDVIIRRANELPFRVRVERATGRFLSVVWTPRTRDRTGAPIQRWRVAFSDFGAFGGVTNVARRATVYRGTARLATRVRTKVTVNAGLKEADFPLP